MVIGFDLQRGVADAVPFGKQLTRLIEHCVRVCADGDLQVRGSSHVSGPRCRNDPVIAQRYGDHRQTMGRPWARLGLQMERTTGFEPATLTLAKNVKRTLRLLRPDC